MIKYLGEWSKLYERTKDLGINLEVTLNIGNH